jgi:guanyl-specific ribonuclease Sa
VRAGSSKQIWSTVLVVAVLLLGWLVVRATQSPGPTDEAPRPGHSVTTPGPTKPGERHTQESVDPVSGLPWISASRLPPQARHTLELIRAGGPYPYPRNDDQVFGNREGLLPREGSGYYREFTVETPGSADRGPRRIVTGARGEKYWTDDHYASFSRIREG